MDDNSRMNDYETSANQYWRWVLGAESLLISASILEEKYRRAQEKKKDHRLKKMPLELEVLAPMIYLKAKSLELLLKALYIKQGNKVTHEGKFVYKTHNLLKLIQNTGISVDETQVKLFKRMSDCITFWGTYPIPLSFDKWRPDTEHSQGVIYFWGPDDDKKYFTFLEGIRSQVNINEDPDLPWSKT